ncbi:hypothetical protein Hypma_000038 [Hypsizygus marmoreus]|uniref:Uncharacterized protein n=1 Tax=Hypsizygus marmoreus TaxID=39966 RepID=A0A369KDU8_HYPMA|nr:hypothetical protein Hypma_000038 [Hypsizygus marmoreus]
MLELWRPSSCCTLYSSYSKFGLSRTHLGIHLRRWQRRYHCSDSSHSIKSTTITTSTKPKDRDFLDLSPEIWNTSFQSALYYYGSVVGSRFPQNSLGFLYYHLDPQLTSISGAVRFRLTPDAHASSFSAGTDLMLPDGRTPWAIWLVTIAKAAKYVGLKQLLISDGLVAPELLEHCKRLGARCGIPNGLNQMYRHTLFRLEQPFVLDLASTPRCSVVGPQQIESFQIKFTLVHRREGDKRMTFFPYSGQCRVRFERSVAPEHAGKHVAVIRVLEILTPIKITDPTFTPGNKTGLFRMPTVGSLLVKGDHPIIINADGDSDIGRCLRLLI